MSDYLRVKNWKDWQHYKDREPPWVKLHSKLLRDTGFGELSEQEQWQLVRIWLVVSSSSRFTHDEQGRVVPVVVDDEQTIRRAIQSLKKVPLAKLVANGWLIRVKEAALLASTVLAPGNHHPPEEEGETDPEGLHSASTLLEAEKGRDLEHLSLDSKAGSSRVPDCLPSENEFLLARLLKLCRDSRDAGTETVFTSYAKQLPPASLAKVIETTQLKPPAIRAAYANGALKSELLERGAIA